jgi:hypothetical protein
MKRLVQRRHAMTPTLLAQFQYACKTLTELARDIRDETNDVVATKDHVQVIKHYDAFRQVNAIIKEARDALTKLEERLSREYVPDVMRLSNIRSTTIEGVGRVSLGTRWSASMIEKEEAMNWLRQSGNSGVIQETVNAQTLGALAKELNATGYELPQDKFTTNVMTYTSITKV